MNDKSPEPAGLRQRASHPAVDRVRGDVGAEQQGARKIGALKISPTEPVDAAALARLTPRSRDALIDTLSPGALKELARRKAREVVLGDSNKSLRAAFRRELYTPVRVMLRDKITFWLSVLGVMATQYVLLARPHLFWAWFSLLSIPLLVWRVYSYTARKVSSASLCCVT